MCLEYFGPMGCGRIYLDDDATEEEIKRVLMIAATTEQGNGGDIFFKQSKRGVIRKEDSYGN